MEIYVLTLFPEMINGIAQSSILKRAQNSQALTITAINIRDFALDKHRVTDDIPYGGGPGMVLKPEPIAAAIAYIESQSPDISFRKIYLSPQGKVWTQAQASAYSEYEGLILLCGHYEGVDQRILDLYIDEEISIGDFVLTGGELPALCIIDSIARLIPGVLGNVDSALQDSFGESGLLDHPHYTRPEVFEGVEVPAVLRSGHHKKISEWRKQQAILNTLSKRPDLLEKAKEKFTKGEMKFLEKLPKNSNE